MTQKGLDKELQVGGDKSSLQELWLPCYNGPAHCFLNSGHTPSPLGTAIEMQILIQEAWAEACVSAILTSSQGKGWPPSALDLESLECLCPLGSGL